MDKKLKTLSLNRETLRRLEPRDLSRVAGGVSPQPSQGCASNSTCDDYRIIPIGAIIGVSW